MKAYLLVCELFHKKTVPFKDEKGFYERCLDCGRRIPISWNDPYPAPSGPLQRTNLLLGPFEQVCVRVLRGLFSQEVRLLTF